VHLNRLLSLSAAGDIFLLDERDIIHTNLSVREGLGEHMA
jgi:hypothetical protein